MDVISDNSKHVHAKKARQIMRRHMDKHLSRQVDAVTFKALKLILFYFT